MKSLTKTLIGVLLNGTEEKMKNFSWSPPNVVAIVIIFVVVVLGVAHMFHTSYDVFAGHVRTLPQKIEAATK